MAQDASESGLGVITRRLFVGAMAGVCVPREGLVLEAIAAERMPHRLLVSGIARSRFFELRDYGATGAHLSAILDRCGIPAVWEENGRFLFPFETLEARERAWRCLSADPEWMAVSGSVALKELAVYRTVRKRPASNRFTPRAATARAQGV